MKIVNVTAGNYNDEVHHLHCMRMMFVICIVSIVSTLIIATSVVSCLDRCTQEDHYKLTRPTQVTSSCPSSDGVSSNFGVYGSSSYSDWSTYSKMDDILSSEEQSTLFRKMILPIDEDSKSKNEPVDPADRPTESGSITLV